MESSNFFDIYRNPPILSDLFYSQFIRTLGKTYTQNADIGECFMALSKVKNNDFDSWYAAWHDMALKIQAIAVEAEKQGHFLSAGQSYMRVFEYHRASEFFLRDDLENTKIIEIFDQIETCFDKGIHLLHTQVQKSQVHFENGFLNGYLFKPQKEARATLVVPGGYDSTVEEMYPLVPRALAEGYAIFIFDGPGQGHVLRRQKLYMRHDFEVVVEAVFDHLENIGDISDKPYVLIGRSFGGYLAPRAACFEKRIAGLVCDPGQYDLPAQLKEILPKETYQQLIKQQDKLVNQYFDELFLKDKQAAFYFKSRMNAHGLKSAYDYLKAMQQYSLKDLAHRITCPTLICTNANDTLSSSSHAFYEALTCPKTMIEFDSSLGAGTHCEMDAYGQFQNVMFEWLTTI